MAISRIQLFCSARIRWESGFLFSAMPFRRGVYGAVNRCSIPVFFCTGVIFSLQCSLTLADWRALFVVQFDSPPGSWIRFLTHFRFGSYEINVAPPTAVVNESDKETNSALRIRSHRTTNIRVDKLQHCFGETIVFPERNACQFSGEERFTHQVFYLIKSQTNNFWDGHENVSKMRP